MNSERWRVYSKMSEWCQMARHVTRPNLVQMKEFDQAGSELGSTVFENNRRDLPDRKPFENQSQRGHGIKTSLSRI